MGCLCCDAEQEVGALCRRCALEVAPCVGLLPDHLHSRIDTTEAEAWEKAHPEGQPRHPLPAGPERVGIRGKPGMTAIRQ